MNNSSGIYQVDGLLKAKLRGSGLEPYVEVVARIDTEAEKRLVPGYRLEIGEPKNAVAIAGTLLPPLRGRLTAGRLALDQEVGVRIPAPQPRDTLSRSVTLVTGFLSICKGHGPSCRSCTVADRETRAVPAGRVPVPAQEETV